MIHETLHRIYRLSSINPTKTRGELMCTEIVSRSFSTCRAVKGFWCLRVRAGVLEIRRSTPEVVDSMVILQNCFVSVSRLNLGCFSEPDKKSFQGLVYFQHIQKPQKSYPLFYVLLYVRYGRCDFLPKYTQIHENIPKYSFKLYYFYYIEMFYE